MEDKIIQCPFCRGNGVLIPYEDDTYCEIACVKCGCNSGKNSSIVDVEEKKYIGDGVYASIENGMLKCETQREWSTHYIYFEPQVLHSLFYQFPEVLKIAEDLINRKKALDELSEQAQELDMGYDK